MINDARNTKERMTQISLSQRTSRMSNRSRGVPNPKRFRVTLLLLVLVGGLLVLIGCTDNREKIRAANQAAASSSISSVEETGKISVFDLRDGDCFNAARIVGTEVEDLENVELVPCSGDWGYRVLSSFVVSLDGDYPGDDYFTNEADRRCGRLTTFFLSPHPDSWEFGDRSVMCLQDR